MQSEAPPFSQTGTAPMTNSFLSSNTKYGGLIKVKASKRIRNSLFLLIGYIDTTSPHFLMMHTIVTFFRFFQLIGPIFFAASERFWPTGEIQQKIVSYISIVFHVVPVEYRFAAATFIQIIYWLILIFYFSLMLISGYVYKTTSKLPKVVVYIISIFEGTVMYLIHPVALQMASQELSRLLMGMETYSGTRNTVICIFITFVFAIFYGYSFAKVMSITLLFRPTSFLTTTSIAQFYLIGITHLITTFLGIATYLSKGPYIALTVLSGLFMIGATYIPFIPGSFVRSLDSRLVLSSLVTGGITCFIIAIMAALNKSASMAVLFVIIAIFVVMMIASFPILDSYEKRCLRILDDFADDTDVMMSIKSQLELIRIACIGYKFAHPACLDWSIFKAATEKWPDSSIIWSTFGKFVAIYPEENSLLNYIIYNVDAKKLKGNFAKQTISQGRNILTQRESSLTTQLKKKLQHVGKTVQHAKRKLRQIWDIVIQGNTHEMESAVNNAYSAVNKAEAEYSHVLIQYPNNRFVARSFARFLQEIKADQKGFLEWLDKIKILQRGLTATVDNTNVLGIEAFPNLPPVLSVKNEGNQIQNNGETESAFQLDVDIEDEQVNDQLSNIRDQIHSLRIPSLCFVSFCSILIFLVLILAPVIAVFTASKLYINSLDKPLEFLYYLSYLRTLANQLPAFAFHSLFENYPNEQNPVFIKPNYTDIELTSLGYHMDTKDQYKFLIKELTTCLEAIGQYRYLGNKDNVLQFACDKVYKAVIQYRFYTNYGNYSIINMSIQSGLMDYSIQLSKLSAINETTPDILKSPLVMNPLVNTEALNNAASYAIECIDYYLRVLKAKMTKLMVIVFVCLICFFFVFYGLVSLFEIRKVQSNKKDIYSCLTSLPKNVVSGLAESLRVLRKDTAEGSRSTEVDTEVSKQQDNILKIFAAAGDSSAMISADRHVFGTCNLLFLLIDALLTYTLTQMFKNVTDKLVENGPQLNYVFGSTAYMMEMMRNFYIAAAQYANAFNYSKKPVEMLKGLTITYSYFCYFYQHARYGGEEPGQPPYPYFKEVTEYAMGRFACKNESEIPVTYKDVYSCFGPDQQTILLTRLIQNLSLPVVLGNATALNSSDPVFDDLWYIGAILLYESFFHPMFGSILPKLERTLAAAIPSALPVCVILVIIAFILGIVIHAFLSIETKKLKFALSLLLHCQSQIIMQTQKIIDVLNGHFTIQEKESTTRNERFFTEVVSSLPDSIITANNQLVIIAANKSTERIYSVESSSLVGTKITDFLSSPYFSDDMSHVVTNASNLSEVTNPIPAKYSRSSGSTNHLELSCVTFGQFYVLTTRDVTRGFVYNTLIKEERAKSDKLLASILPPSMVVRVQKGEKNISFAVQSATILFLDIVSFTPWCASNTAAMVMHTLNEMFKLLDNKLATHPTATKIKCIGDCYMCAGGIFSELNQPNVHAKEIVEFGLESIECIRQLDKKDNLELQIRVGINTGGPIVAGVLGTEKPTFEILGPAINMAQQMEHHGVPMQVHISRSVYELIYGGSFVIKERGQIVIKSGKVITYLVQEQQ